MTTFQFRLRFGLPPKSFIAEDADHITLTVPSDNQQITLWSCPPDSLMNTVVLDVIAGGFQSVEAALSYGRDTRDALAICCALLGMGARIGESEECFSAADVIISPQSGQSHVRPASLDGIVVYPQDCDVEGFYVKVSDRGGPPRDRFQQYLVRSFELRQHLDDRLKLALELYNTHLFEVTLRSRFLQLISAVECLAQPQRQPPAIVNLVKDLVKLSEDSLAAMDGVSANDSRDFVQRVHYLKRESISRACRNLVQVYLGDEAVTRFRTCYSLRSKLVHEGEVPSEADLHERYSDLNGIVRDLLYKALSEDRAR